MKNILIVSGSFSIGGSRTSLCSLLSVMDSNKVHVDLFVREKKGPLKASFVNCTILPENVWLSYKVFEKGFIIKIMCYILYIIRGALQKVGVDMFKIYNYIGGKQINSEKYDAVIGFDETLTRFISFLPAKKRISWLHCDYRRYAKGIDESKYFKRVDRVVCVSKFARETIVEVLPQLQNKIVIIRNAINVGDIVTKSKMKSSNVELFFSNEAKEKFTIISIGRLEPVKQFDKIPSIAAEVKKILNNRHKFQWLIVGGGDDAVKKKIESEIYKNRVENEVKCLGMQTNPYPFLGKSDLYVCTSSSETFSYTIHEGLALKVPFVCNDFPGAFDSVQVGNEGFILPLSEMPQKIAYIISHPMIVNECTITNEHLLDVFYNII